jgi:GNAT superfamily N-acetyltransferase
VRLIRIADANDIPALVAFDTVATFNPERGVAIAAWVEARQCYIACDDDSPVGYAVLTRGFFHSPYVEMLMVAERARLSGVGRTLIEHCMGLTPPG